MEEQLQNNNVRGIWKSLKTIYGQETQPPGCKGQKGVNDLNLFFNRFDHSLTPTQLPLLHPPLLDSQGTALTLSPYPLFTTHTS